jgi:hypothetical protein
MTFFHTQHIELNFKGYFKDGDSLVLVENGRSFAILHLTKSWEYGHIHN